MDAIQTSRKLMGRVPQALLDSLVGLTMLATGKPKQSHRLFARAVSAQPSEPLVYYWAARAAWAAGEGRAARARIREAHALGSHLVEVRMGSALLDVPSVAAKALGELAKSGPILSRPRFYPTPEMGAIALLTTMLAKFPRPMELQRTRAHLLYRNGAVLEARSLLQQLLKKRPRDADALQVLARIANALGSKSGLSLARRAASADPNLPTAQLLLGEMLLQAGHTKEAMAKLQKAVDARPNDATALTTLARACHRAQRQPCALKFYRYALRQDRTLASAHFGLGRIEQQKGALESAYRHFKAATRIQPVVARYHLALAQLLDLQKEGRKAKRALRHAADARRFQAEFQRQVARHERRRRALFEAKRWCGCQHGPCREAAAPQCRRAVGRLRGIARTFFDAHLQMRRDSASAGMQQSLPGLVKRLRAKRPYRRGIREITLRGRIAGREVRQSRQLPLMPF